jgi:hypothetical protein
VGLSILLLKLSVLSATFEFSTDIFGTRNETVSGQLLVELFVVVCHSNITCIFLAYKAYLTQWIELRQSNHAMMNILQKSIN